MWILLKYTEVQGDIAVISSENRTNRIQILAEVVYALENVQGEGGSCQSH